MSVSDELRAAAARIREVAVYVPEGPWRFDRARNKVIGSSETTVIDTYEGYGTPALAEHIALFDPIVAELVVPILELEAKQWDAYDHQNSRPGDARTRVMPHELDNAVLALARAINGGAS